MRTYRACAVAGVVVVGLVGGVASPALAAPGSPSNWHVGIYAPSNRTLSMGEAAHTATGLAAFRFTTAQNTALLITTQGSQSGNLLGDLYGERVSATFTISGTDPCFTYYGDASANCDTGTSVRLFFETSAAGGFAETHYWWSNPVGAAELGKGTITLSATITPAEWSDFYGHFGNASGFVAAFEAAAANVTGIGLSFGGGNGFENGVGAPDASLTLTSFSVTPAP